MPPFALGRAFFDNWLIWDARRRGLPVVDLTEVVPALHQDHAYDHLEGGRRAAYAGEDARRNLELAGGGFISSTSTTPHTGAPRPGCGETVWRRSGPRRRCAAPRSSSARSSAAFAALPRPLEPA